jgi:hypothetical protein
MRASISGVMLLTTMTLLSGCVGGNFLVNNSTVKIRTTPRDALATSEYGDSCRTPCTLRLRTSRGGTIRLSKAGYEDEEISIGSHFDEVAAAAEAVRTAVDPDPINVAVEGLFGLTDPEGQYRRLNARRIEVALQPLGAGGPQEPQPAEASVQEQGGAVARLSREEVDALLGPPLPTTSQPGARRPISGR